jgi:hypothetical protein
VRPAGLVSVCIEWPPEIAEIIPGWRFEGLGVKASQIFDLL